MFLAVGKHVDFQNKNLPVGQFNLLSFKASHSHTTHTYIFSVFRCQSYSSRLCLSHEMRFFLALECLMKFPVDFEMPHFLYFLPPLFS